MIEFVESLNIHHGFLARRQLQGQAEEEKKTVITSARVRCSKGKGKGIGIWIRDRAPLALLTRAESSSPFLSNVRLGQRRHHWYPHKMTSEKKKELLIERQSIRHESTN